jgi:hypothetical protein
MWLRTTFAYSARYIPKVDGSREGIATLRWTYEPPFPIDASERTVTDQRRGLCVIHDTIAIRAAEPKNHIEGDDLMSFIRNKGAAAAEAAKTEKVDTSKVFKKFKAGASFKVRFTSTEDLAGYLANSVFGVFNTTPTEKPDKPTLYDRASEVLLQEANAAKKAGNDDLSSELWKQAKALEAKPRFLLGFINLDDGLPVVVDLTETQGGDVAKDLAVNAKKLDRFAFAISKEGKGTDTKVKIRLLDPEDDSDLNETQRKHFTATAGAAFNHDLFDHCLAPINEQEQIAGLIKFGFDVSKIGVNISVGSAQNDADATPIPPTDPEEAF